MVRNKVFIIIPRCLVIIYVFIISLNAIPSIPSLASDNILLVELKPEMQCAAAINGIAYKDNLYFVYDNQLYRYNTDTEKRQHAPDVFIDNASDFFIKEGYVYYREYWSNNLYRTSIGNGGKEIISGDVTDIIYMDENYLYYWGRKSYYSGKKKLYRVSFDGKNHSLVFSNKGNPYSIDEANGCSSACIYDGMLIYSKGKNDRYGNYADYKICCKDLENGEKRKLLSPKGKNDPFGFYILDNELYAVCQEKIYRYDAEKMCFTSISGCTFTDLEIIGKDDQYIYATDETDSYNDNTEANIYRIGKDWKAKKLFSITGLTSNMENVRYLSAASGYYCFLFYNESVSWAVCTDDMGRIVYKRNAWNDGITRGYIDEYLDVDMAVKNDVLYILCHDSGWIGGAEMVHLDEH